MSGRAAVHRGIRGSAALATAPLDAAPPAEALEPGDMRRLPFADELLGAVRVRGSFAPIPLDAFDRACTALRAEEQAAYLHLLRLSVGEGRNWCRVRKRELMDRLRLSERRLLGVLDALVAARFARPLHRDNRGTLWRVYLPREAFGERLGDDVLVGRASALRIVRGGGEAGAVASAKSVAMSAATSPSTTTPTTTTAATPTTTTAATPTPTATPTATPTPTAHRREISPLPRASGGEGQGEGARATAPGAATSNTTATLSRALAVARGRTDPEGLAHAAREVRDLLAEGQTPARIAAAIETVRRRARGRREDA